MHAGLFFNHLNYLCILLFTLCSFKGIVHPKMKIVIIYSPSSSSKPENFHFWVNYPFKLCTCVFVLQNEVLLIQEAKAVCLGSWYLPAGRMEDGESIEESLKREVKEEAGIDCQPITLLQIQEKGPSWIRFAFLAEKTG